MTWKLEKTLIIFDQASGTFHIVAVNAHLLPLSSPHLSVEQVIDAYHGRM
jgi:hypothetical protein